MSYLVLARKYRPISFDQVVGQEHITKTLAGALASGRLAHAFCFTGPRGVGKTTVARLLAKAVNCVNGPTDQPCHECTVCREIEEGRAVDVQEIDAASNSRVEDVRELREMIRYRPQAARFRVTILDEVHMLSKAAFNALLKTLEEPPEHAVFILATTDVHKVPLTILSRCQRYDFRRLSPKTLVNLLDGIIKSENVELAPESLSLIAREADGSGRDALSLLDQVLSLGKKNMGHKEVVELLGLVDHELVRGTAQAVLDGRAGDVLDLVSQVYAAGGEMQSFYADLEEHFRNLAASLAAPADTELFGLTGEEMAGLKAQAKGYSPETLHEIFDHLARSEELFRRSNQPRLVMEMTLLKLTQVKPVLSLDEVIKRLGQAAGPEKGESGPRNNTPAAPPASPAVNPASAAPAAPAASANPAAQDVRARADSPRRPEPAPGKNAAEPAAPATAQTAPPAERPSSGGGSLPGPEKALKALGDQCARSEPTFGSYLSRGQAEFKDGAFNITMPASPLARSLCTVENEAKLAGLLSDLYGFKGAVNLKARQAEPRAPRRDMRKDLASSVAEHPAVREAMEVFEAQVVALNPEVHKD